MELTKDKIVKQLNKSAAAQNSHGALAICSVSGMGFVFAGLPPVDNHVLVVESPLKKWQNVRGYALRSRAWLEKQDSSFLAGLIIAGLSKWDLLVIGEGSTAEANILLSNASITSLVTIVGWVGKMDHINTKGLPALVIEWHDVKSDKFNVTAFMQGFVDRLRPYFDQAYKDQIRIEEIKKANTHKVMDESLKRMGIQLAGGEYLSAKQTYKEREKQAEERVKEAKKAIKAALATNADWLNPKRREMLHSLTQESNLVIMSDTLRNTICQRLKELGQDKLAELIAGATNQYDIFAKASQELDRASDLAYEMVAESAGEASTLTNSATIAEIAEEKPAMQSKPAEPLKHAVKSIKELIALRKQSSLVGEAKEAIAANASSVASGVASGEEKDKE